MIATADILSQTAHRPWPLPSGPWVMEQGWYNLLFAHWQVPPAQMRALIPAELELDTYDASAWVSITPFRLTMRPRGATVLGRVWSFPEMNFRTYVRYGGKAGIYFFSLDAASLLAVMGARMLYRLPYFHARMGISRSGEVFQYESKRIRAAREFRAVYEPVSEPRNAAPGSLSHWLAERYCLYVTDGGRVRRAEIHHGPWPLQNARVEIERNTLPAQAGLVLGAMPDLVQYAEALEVLIWPLRDA
jgi:uncharacterized protein YqjF (DUF2071 family)